MWLLSLCVVVAGCGGTSAAGHSSATTVEVRVAAISGTYLTGGGGPPRLAPALSGPKSLSTGLTAVKALYTDHGGRGWSNAPSADTIYDAVDKTGPCRTFVVGPKGTLDVGEVGTTCAVARSGSGTRQATSLFVAMIQTLVPAATSWLRNAMRAGRARSYGSSAVDVVFGPAQGSPRGRYLFIQAKGYRV